MPRDTPPTAQHRQDIGPLTISHHLSLHVDRKWPRSDIDIDREVSISPTLTREAREMAVDWGTGGDLIRENSVHIRRSKNQEIIHARICLPGQDRPIPLDTGTPFPFLITVTTFSPPVKFKAEAKPGKFGPSSWILEANSEYIRDLCQFSLRRKIITNLGTDNVNVSSDICATLGKLDGEALNVGKPEWVQYLSLKGKGRWVQQFAFWSCFDLTSRNVMPSFKSTACIVSVRLLVTVV